MATDLKSLGHDLKKDTQIGCGLVELALFSQQGLQLIQQNIQGAKDPVQVLAHIIFIAIAKADQGLKKRKLEIDPKVWIAGGGVLDRVIFDLMGILITAFKFQPAANSGFVGQVKSAVLDLMHDNEHGTGPGGQSQEDMNQQQAQQQQQQPQPQPQQAGPPQQGAPPQQQGLLTAGGPPNG